MSTEQVCRGDGHTHSRSCVHMHTQLSPEVYTSGQILSVSVTSASVPCNYINQITPGSTYLPPHLLHHPDPSSTRPIISLTHHHPDPSSPRSIITQIHHHPDSSSPRFIITPTHHHPDPSSPRSIITQIHHHRDPSSPRPIITPTHPLPAHPDDLQVTPSLFLSPHCPIVTAPYIAPYHSAALLQYLGCYPALCAGDTRASRVGCLTTGQLAAEAKVRDHCPHSSI